VTLASHPSFLARVPGGAAANCAGVTEIWVETVIAPTGNLAVAVQYTDDLGNTGHTTGAVGIAAAPTIGRMWQLPLAAGDKGISVVERVTATVATVGAACFNVHVMRPLWTGRAALPTWWTGQRFTRSVISVLAGDWVQGLPASRQAIQFLPLVLAQFLAIAGIVWTAGEGRQPGPGTAPSDLGVDEQKKRGGPDQDAQDPEAEPHRVDPDPAP
jgi:hypothetical protein